jgi:hypothetical protein
MDFITLLQGLIHDPSSNLWLAMILVLLGAIMPFIRVCCHLPGSIPKILERVGGAAENP